MKGKYGGRECEEVEWNGRLWGNLARSVSKRKWMEDIVELWKESEEKWGVVLYSAVEWIEV